MFPSHSLRRPLTNVSAHSQSIGRLSRCIRCLSLSSGVSESGSTHRLCRVQFPLAESRNHILASSGSVFVFAEVGELISAQGLPVWPLCATIAIFLAAAL